MKLSLDYLLGSLKHQTFSETSMRRWAGYDPRYSHHFPIFTLSTIATMLNDPRIKFGLNLIKGPICTYTKFFSEEESKDPSLHQAIVELNYHFPYAVICKNKQQEEYILRQFNRLWSVGIFKVMKSVEWGWSGCEVLYKKSKQYRLEFDNLRSYRSEQLQVHIKDGRIIGFSDTSDPSGYIPIGKGMWSLHEREENMYYGNSRLRGAHIPWHETWMLGGARDTRRIWYFKNSYDGGEIYYPEGSYNDPSGNTVPNEELALRMAEAKRSGATAVFPSTKGLDGKRAWELVPAKANVTPQGLMEYVEALRDEELEGLGIPPEVVSNSGSQGMGAATGRMVPLMAFIASLTPLGSDIIHDFRNQVLDRILLPANGFTEDYDLQRIVPKSINGQPATPVQEKTVPDSGV